MLSDFMWQSAVQRNSEFHRTADCERRAKASDPHHRPLTAPRVTLRVDRVWDSVRLHDLAQRPLPNDSFVIGEVDGRIVAALPLSGGRAFTDPDTETAQLLPLLELRANQISRVAMRKRRLWVRLHRA